MPALCWALLPVLQAPNGRRHSSWTISTEPLGRLHQARTGSSKPAPSTLVVQVRRDVFEESLSTHSNNLSAQWGTGEVETYTSSSSNVRLYTDTSKNGHLWIVPQRSSSGAWTSGRVESRRSDFTAPAGGKLRVEASIKMPDVTGSNGLGYWPAFWLVGGAFRGNYTNWPEVGEIDIMENINGQDTITEVLHCVSRMPCGLVSVSSTNWTSGYQP